MKAATDTLTCGGDGGCLLSDVSSGFVECLGPNACKVMDLVSLDGVLPTVQCYGPTACWTDMEAQLVQCWGYRSCLHAVITTGKATSGTLTVQMFGYKSASNTKVHCGAGMTCHVECVDPAHSGCAAWLTCAAGATCTVTCSDPVRCPKWRHETVDAVAYAEARALTMPGRDEITGAQEEEDAGDVVSDSCNEEMCANRRGCAGEQRTAPGFLLWGYESGKGSTLTAHCGRIECAGARSCLGSTLHAGKVVVSGEKATDGNTRLVGDELEATGLNNVFGEATFSTSALCTGFRGCSGTVKAPLVQCWGYGGCDGLSVTSAGLSTLEVHVRGYRAMGLSEEASIDCAAGVQCTVEFDDWTLGGYTTTVACHAGSTLAINGDSSRACPGQYEFTGSGTVAPSPAPTRTRRPTPCSPSNGKCKKKKTFAIGCGWKKSESTCEKASRCKWVSHCSSADADADATGFASAAADAEAALWPLDDDWEDAAMVLAVAAALLALAGAARRWRRSRKRAGEVRSNEQTPLLL